MPLTKRLIARFYRTLAGNRPVRDWLLGLDDADRKTVGEDIAVLEFGWPVGMPISRSIGKNGLREIRSTIKKGKVEARIVFGIDGNELILLHGFEKRPSQQDAEIATGEERWRDYKTAKGWRQMIDRDPGPVGETFESFLGELGLRDEVYGAAIKRVVAWQFEEARKSRALTKKDMAASMKTSRSQLDRVLDPDNVSVSLDMLNRAASALGKRLRVELEDAT